MKIRYFLLLVLCLALVACGQQLPATPAPPGDYAALEKLAAAYRRVGADYPVQPQSMRPAGRKEFVQRVFQSAGYDYSASLLALAGQGLDAANQEQRDLAQLLLLPHRGLDREATRELYSSEELAAIQAIEAALR